MEQCGVRHRRMSSSQTISTPPVSKSFELPLCMEFSRAFPALCNVFLPIITPAYLERIGIQDGKKVNSTDYGVVFEEWQGGLFMVQQGYLSLIPVVRRGAAHQLNLNQISSIITTHGGLIDLRGNDPTQYQERLEKILRFISRIDVTRNPFSLIDIQTWCDTYIEWCRVKIPDRFHAPVDIWPFYTYTANEFLGEVGTLFRTVNSTRTDIGTFFKQWQADLRLQASRANYRLRYIDLINYTSCAILSQNVEFGWQYLEKTADFCGHALQTAPLDGDAIERTRAQNNVGLAMLRLSKKKTDPEGLRGAIQHFRAAGEILLPDTHGQDWLKLQANLAAALRWQGELDNNTASWRESIALYEAIARVSVSMGDELRHKEALAAIEEMKARPPA